MAMGRPLRRFVPHDALERVRLLSLLLAVGSGVIQIYRMGADGVAGPGVIVVAQLSLAALCLWWIAGYYRRDFPLSGLPVEGLVLLLMSYALGGPIRAFGLFYVALSFRSLYGNGLRGLLPAVTWEVVLIVGLVTIGTGPGGPLLLQIVQSPAILLGALAIWGTGMWLLAQSLAERERGYQRERLLMLDREREANEKAQALAELNTFKDRLLERVSHELRTPLTAIRSYSELLITYDDPTVQREFAGIINSEAVRLTRLLNDVLDLTKIQSGTLTWQMESVEVRALLEEAERNYRPLLEGSGLDLDLIAEHNLGVIVGDRDRLLQVMTNLLGNAQKFTAAGGVSILGRRVEEAVEVSIADSGVGVPEAELERIFERFHQAENHIEGRQRGTGLGLAICREIVEHHGGKLWAARREGGGTVFSFTLPVHAEAGRGDEQAPTPRPGTVGAPVGLPDAS